MPDPSTPVVPPPPPTPTPKKTDKEIAIEKADQNIKDKQDAVTKANDAAVAAHAELMNAERERASLGV